MLKMRLKRVGRRNTPLFRVVVTEGSAGPKSGKAIEVLGSYNPHENLNTINTERASHWISKGVQPSGTVHNLLVDLGVVKGKKINVLPQKSPVKTEVPEEEKSAPVAEETVPKGEEEAAMEAPEEKKEELEKAEEEQTAASEKEESATEEAPKVEAQEESSDEESKEEEKPE